MSRSSARKPSAPTVKEPHSSRSGRHPGGARAGRLGIAECVRTLLESIRGERASGPDTEHWMRQLTECAARVLNVERAGVWSLEPALPQEPMESPAEPQPEPPGATDSLLCIDEFVRTGSQHLSGARLLLHDQQEYLQALREEDVIPAQDVRRHRATHGLVERGLRELGVVSSLEVPIRSAQKTLGVLRLLHVGTRRRWRANEVLLAVALASGAALMRERMEQGRTDDHLRLNEEQLRLAIQSTEDGLWDWDIVSGEMRSSLLWGGMLGYEPGTIAPTAEAYATLIHPDDLPGVNQRYADYVQGRASEFHSVHRMRHRSGRWIWVRSRGKIVARTTDGQPLRIIGTNVDISEHKRIEAELRSKNALLDAIRDAQDRFIVAPDMKATFERMLSTVLRLTQSEYGFIAEVQRDAAGQPILKTHAISNIAWDEPTRSFYEQHAPAGLVFANLDALFGAVLTSGRPVLANEPSFEPRRGGVPAGHPPLKAFMGLPFFHQGEMLGVVGVANPPSGYSEESVEELAPLLATCASLTAALRERDRSRVAEQERDRFFEMAVDPLCILDPEGTLRRVNAAFAQRIGYTPAEISGRPFLEFVHPEERTATRSVLQAMRSVSERVRFESRCLCRDGSSRWLSWNATAASERGDIYAIARDITEQRQAEEERQRLTEQLIQAQKMEAVGRLAGGIAHDFNNILTTIQGCGSLLQQSLYRHPDAELANEILSASERAAALTRQLLAFSRKQLLSPILLDLGKVISSMRGMLQQLLGEQIKLRVSVAPGVGQVRVDPSRIEQVIVNLTVNARESMPDGGELRISVRGLPPPEAPPGASDSERPAGQVELVFSDNGQGLSEESRAHLFEPFFSSKGSGRSSGLGLATVYGIVTQSGGRISVESVPGGGTSFCIVFPTSSTASAPSTGRARGEHVLVVEDDKAVREMLIYTLRALDYQVFAAVDGLDAIELQERTGLQPDLLLTDVIMPNLGGPDLARHMQQRQPGLRVLFMTGFSGDADLQRGLAERSFAVLQKPFMPNQLARAVRALLDAPR
jgi:two-component system cell cycle sensor histidine kinase/response regulator CckA